MLRKAIVSLTLQFHLHFRLTNWLQHFLRSFQTLSLHNKKITKYSDFTINPLLHGTSESSIAHLATTCSKTAVIKSQPAFSSITKNTKSFQPVFNKTFAKPVQQPHLKRLASPSSMLHPHTKLCETYLGSSTHRCRLRSLGPRRTSGNRRNNSCHRCRGWSMVEHIVLLKKKLPLDKLFTSKNFNIRTWPDKKKEVHSYLLFL